MYGPWFWVVPPSKILIVHWPVSSRLPDTVNVPPLPLHVELAKGVPPLGRKSWIQGDDSAAGPRSGDENVLARGALEMKEIAVAVRGEGACDQLAVGDQLDGRLGVTGLTLDRRLNRDGKRHEGEEQDEDGQPPGAK